MTPIPPTQQPAVLPVLYSYRNCPYCIRARLGIVAAGIQVELREVDLKNKPESLLKASPKGSVPVLIETDGTIIDESADILQWAIKENPPLGWMSTDEINQSGLDQLLEAMPSTLTRALLRKKYPERFPSEEGEPKPRKQAGEFFKLLEQRLTANRYLFGDRISHGDIMIVPFVLQFSELSEKGLRADDYPKLHTWKEGFRHTDLYRIVMQESPVWQENTPGMLFPS